MSFNVKRAVGGVMLTALVAGGVALTAAVPATADTATQAGPVVKAAVQGDRIQGPFVTRSAAPEYTSFAQMQWNEWTRASDGHLAPTSEQTGGAALAPPASLLDGEIWTFPAVGTTGPIMNSQGQCLQPAIPIGPNYPTTMYFPVGSCDNAAVASIAADGVLKLNGAWVSDTFFRDPPNYLVVLNSTAPSTRQSADTLYLGAMTPVAAADCTAGLTGSVSNINQTAKSAVLSGTGAAGETITVTTPNGPVTTVVAANGSWTTTVTNLAEGDNALTVNSSDNCAPVELSVIIEELAIPVAHPAAATAAGVLGLGALLFGGIRRRNTARI